jgi:hypothetical protein
MKKKALRPDIWSPDKEGVGQVRERQPQKPQQQQQPKAKPEIKQMNDGNWMLSKPTGKPGEWLRQIWDKTKKNMIREWTVSAKRKDYKGIIKAQVEERKYKKAPLTSHGGDIMFKIGQIDGINQKDITGAVDGFTSVIVDEKDKQRYLLHLKVLGERDVFEGDPEFELEEVPQDNG